MPEGEQFGRTGWDVLSGLKWKIIIFLLALGIVGGLVYFFVTNKDVLLSFAEEYWPILIAPVAGWFLGSYVVKRVYSTRRRVVMTLDPETHMVRFVSIPDKLFSDMKQAGNNVVYHTPYGTPVYVANSLNFETGEIDYGWVHELNAVVVMTRENAYVKWDKTLNDVLEENLELMSHPHIIGLGYARKTVRDNLDDIAESLGFKEKDLDAHLETKPEQEEQGDDDLDS